MAVNLGDEGEAGGKSRDGLISAQSVHEGAPVPEDGSIAVLSFTTFGDEPGTESYGDSVSEQVLNLLAHTQDLKVRSRSSSFVFRGQNLSTLQLGQALDVANLVEGSVHYFDGQIRITAQLVDTASDRMLANLLHVQSQIAAEIAAAVKKTLLTGAQASLSCKQF
jgi:TolB-like protein